MRRISLSIGKEEVEHLFNSLLVNGQISMLMDQTFR